MGLNISVHQWQEGRYTDFGVRQDEDGTILYNLGDANGESVAVFMSPARALELANDIYSLLRPECVTVSTVEGDQALTECGQLPPVIPDAVLQAEFEKNFPGRDWVKFRGRPNEMS